MIFYKMKLKEILWMIENKILESFKPKLAEG
jgi:hypothetical protein